MKIIKRDLKHAVVVIEVTSLDDLWYLSQVIDVEDFVKTKTSRKVKLGEDASKVVKKTYVLEIKAEKIEFSTESLRVNGTVLSEVDDIPKGAYHALGIEIGSVVTITKKEWLQFQLDRLEDASRDVPKVFLVAVDRGEVSFGVLRQFGVEVLSELSGSVQKKYAAEDIREDFFANVAKEICAYDARLSPEYIVLGSPAFWKDELLNKIDKTDSKVAKKVVLATISATGKAGLEELVKRDEVRKVLQADRTVKESKMMEEVLKEIGRNGNVSYGINEVESAAFAGAVKEVLVSEKTLRTSREDGTFARYEEIMKSVEKSGGKVMIISEEHDSGKQLAGLGGIAALLRYKL